MIKEFQEEYRWLSNFYNCIVMFEREKYTSVERAYMAAKYNGTLIIDGEEQDWRTYCRRAHTNGLVKRNSHKIKLDKTWHEKTKFEVMFDLLKQKFSQDYFKNKLLATNDEFIQEGNKWGDKVWGVCLKTNQGENHLGKMIMLIREALKENKPLDELIYLKKS